MYVHTFCNKNDRYVKFKWPARIITLNPPLRSRFYRTYKASQTQKKKMNCVSNKHLKNNNFLLIDNST